MGGATICLIQGTTNEQVTADYFRSVNLQFQPVVFERAEQAEHAPPAGRVAEACPVDQARRGPGLQRDPHHGPRYADRPAARAEQHLDAGRSALRAADALNGGAGSPGATSPIFTPPYDREIHSNRTLR